MMIERLQEEYRLSNRERNRVYKQIKSTIVRGARATRECNIIMGQYACGKSALSHELAKSGFVIVDNSVIKKMHPKYEYLLNQYHDMCSEIIAPDWVFWQNQLIEDMTKKGLSFNYETSFNNISIIDMLVDNGYKINLFVIINDYVDSRLRAYERYIWGTERNDGIGMISSEFQYSSYVRMMQSLLNMDFNVFNEVHFLDGNLYEYPFNKNSFVETQVKRIKSFDLSFISYNRRLDSVENFISRYPELIEDFDELKQDIGNIREHLNNHNKERFVLKLNK